jgi:hypothetical protein
MIMMKFPREFIEQLTPAQRIELAQNPMKFAAALYNFEVASESNTALKTSKPASDYVAIPDWLEAEILKLSDQERLFLVNDLTWAIIHSKWNLVNDVSPVDPLVYNWLDTQDRDTFKALLQWVAMELI